MEDLKRLSKKELAKRMLNYINQTEQLRELIAEYIKKRDEGKADLIRQMYKSLKDNINSEYKYADKITNDDMDDVSVVHNCYRHGIIEAGVKGFTVKANAEINQIMFNAVEEVLFYLSYYMGKNELEKYLFE